MSRILVIGASGTVGTLLVGNLKSMGHEVVRATSQTEPAAGQVHLDLVSGAGRAQAFAGVDKAFLLSPSAHTNADELLNPLVDEAREAGLKKVVLMTAMGTSADDASPLRQVEIHLEQSGLAYNIIRPNWFMQNFNTFWLEGIRTSGIIALPVGDARTGFIDARDIAATAAALLDTDRFNNRDFDLTGPESLTHEEVARHISAATGRDVRFQDIPPEAMLAHLRDAGLPPAYAEFLVMLLGHLKQGHYERRTDAVASITGNPPIAFEQYARDYRQVWVG